jgi:uncharacterized surface protein with fasciclin (FAS1) repeats
MSMTALRSPRRALGALAAVALVSLSACSKDEPAEQASAEPTDETLTAAISDADDLSVVATALDDSGLAEVFDGAGSYTIFAPSDAAFDALGETGQALREPGQRAAMAAVLRDHIVPGYLTPTDIEAAIEAQGGSVKVETMGDHALTFSRADSGIRVTSEDGSNAMLTGDALKARNGVAIALDGVLKKVDAPSA